MTIAVVAVTAVAVTAVASIPAVAAASVTATGSITTTAAGTTTLIGELAITGISMGPVGWFLLGTEPTTTMATFDCWKPVLHDNSKDPSSRGILLRDLIRDPRILNVTVEGVKGQLPTTITLTNVWNEDFRLEYVILSNKEMSLHAVRCN